MLQGFKFLRGLRVFRVVLYCVGLRSQDLRVGICGVRGVN